MESWVLKSYLHIHIHSSVICNSQEVETTPKSISEEKDNKYGSYKHTMEYYQALKWKEALPHATTWMQLVDIMLNEISQSENNRYAMIPLMWGS